MWLLLSRRAVHSFLGHGFEKDRNPLLACLRGLMARRLTAGKRPPASERKVGKRPAASPRFAGPAPALPALPDPVKLAKTAVRKGTFSKGLRNLLLRRIWAGGAEKSEDDLTSIDLPFLSTSVVAGQRNYDAYASNVSLGQALICKTHCDQGFVDTTCLFRINDILEHRTGLLLEADLLHATSRPKRKYLDLLETKGFCLHLCRSGQACEAFEGQGNVIHIHDWKAVDGRCLDEPWVPATIRRTFSQNDQPKSRNAPRPPIEEYFDSAANRHELDPDDDQEDRNQDATVIHDDSAQEEEPLPLPPPPDPPRGRQSARSPSSPFPEEPRLGPLARLQCRGNEALAAAEAKQNISKGGSAFTPSKSPSLAQFKEELAAAKHRFQTAGEQDGDPKQKKVSR